MPSLAGKTAVVTGASSGIGAAIASALESEGVAVAGGARRTERLETEVRLPLDVTDAASCERFVETAARSLGGLDVLVNAAGLALGRDPFDASSEEDERVVLETNVNGLIRMTRLCLPHLRASGHGRVVNITSSSVREPIPNLALSNAVRPGVVGWAKTLAREVGPRGITVNSIAPGRIETERLREVYPDGPSEADLAAIPLRRLGQPGEIADLVCFLASDRAAYITGTVISVDGGLARGLL